MISSSCPLSYSCPPSSSHLLSCLGLSFSSRLIVLAEVARVEEEEVGSSEVASSGKASLSEKVVLVLLAVEAGAVKEGSGFLPSRRVSRSCPQSGPRASPLPRSCDTIPLPSSLEACLATSARVEQEAANCIDPNSLLIGVDGFRRGLLIPGEFRKVSCWEWCIIRSWCRQGEFGILPSRQVRVRVPVLEAGQRRINLASGPDSVNGSVEQSWELVVLIHSYRGKI